MESCGIQQPRFVSLAARGELPVPGALQSMQTDSWLSVHLVLLSHTAKMLPFHLTKWLLIKDLRFSEQVCICPHTCSLFTANFPCATPESSPCIHQGWKQPCLPWVCSQKTPTLSAVLLKATVSNICVNSLGTGEGEYLTSERAQDICIQCLHERTPTSLSTHR